MFSVLEGFVECIVAAAMMALFGGVIGIAVSGGSGSHAAAGAMIGAGAAIFTCLVGGALRRMAKRKGVSEPGTIVSVISQPPPGSPADHYTSVLIDLDGKPRKLKLTPAQAQEFADKYSEGDVGRVTYSGDDLIDFTPTAAAAPEHARGGSKVFISYAHGNDLEEQTAEYLGEILETSGLKPSIDKSEVREGEHVRAQVIEQIRNADYFMPLLSREYMTSDACLQEFETAVKAQVPMRPIKITPGHLVPPPHLKKLYDEAAGEPVYVDIHSHNAPQQLRELAEEMLRGKVTA